MSKKLEEVPNKYYEVCDDAIDRFKKICEDKILPNGISFAFIGTDKQKELIKVSKIPDQYQFLLNKDILVIINEKTYDLFDEDELLNILFEQEIDKIYYDSEHDKIKFNKPDLITTSGILNK